MGANDGMLHAFDIGQFDRTTGRFTAGTGKEVWAYMPRAVLPSVRDVAEGGAHRFMVDGTPAVGDVFIDPVFGVAGPLPDERRWRTVTVTGLREGGAAYFALDVTQPEEIEVDPVTGDLVPKPAVPGVPGCIAGGGTCGPVPYPAALWEFTDSTADSLVALPPATPAPLDDDANGAPDLGDTWGRADIGRIRICDGGLCNPNVLPNDVIDMYVAVFAGGMDAEHKDFDPRSDPDPGVRGNWIYMVDVETGKVIYKRRLDHAAPASPATVDTNQDGYLDRIYIGTLGGSFYRIDLTADGAGNLPKLTTVVSGARDLNGFDYDVDRIVEDSAGNPTWVPVKIFDANFDGTDPTDVPRPIYQAPSVFFVTQLGLYGVAFGTGDREDLWFSTPEGATGIQDGRFILFVDDTGLNPAPPLPLDENDLNKIQLGVFDPLAPNYLLGGLGQKGWFIELEDKERVISQAFSLLGLTFFSSFEPDVALSGSPKTCDKADVDQDKKCSKSGTSKIFLTSTTNAEPFFKDAAGNPSRYLEVSGAFVSNPFTEIGYSSGGGGGGGSSDDLTDDEKEVMEAIKALFPPNCRFTNQRVDVKLVASDTRIQRIAAVPVCVIEKNWREF